MARDDEIDSETRAATLKQAWDGLTHLVTGQCSGNTIDAEELGAVMLVFGDYLKRAIPNGGPLHPRGCNDDI